MRHHANSKHRHMFIIMPSVYIAIVQKCTFIHIWSDIIIMLSTQNEQHRYRIAVVLLSFNVSNVTTTIHSSATCSGNAKTNLSPKMNQMGA